MKFFVNDFKILARRLWQTDNKGDKIKLAKVYSVII
jgi:hypothetical protein